MLSGFLGCFFKFGYIAAVVVHYTPALFCWAPQPRAREPDGLGISNHQNELTFRLSTILGKG